MSNLIVSIVEDNHSTETENRIINAATKVFIEKGRAGCSMQDIADEAGINRTLLNYYFRSKKKLFDIVFDKVFLRFIPEINKLMTAKKPAKEKYEQFIDCYTNILIESPLTPIFILNEANNNPEMLIETLKSRGIDPELILHQIQEEIDAGNLVKSDPKQLLVNILSLIIFPFVAKPVVKGFILEGNDREFIRFVNERKKFLKENYLNNIILKS